jgi:hypothetical protein
MAVEKVEISFYRMNQSEVVNSMFTQNARNTFYFFDEDTKNLYYILNRKKMFLPFKMTKALFSKRTITLYPIGTEITDKTNNDRIGVIESYDLDYNRYEIKTKNNFVYYINFNNATIIETYYFISSSGKVQRDYVGRDNYVELFRKANNNFFEDKSSANKRLVEINLQL